LPNGYLSSGHGLLKENETDALLLISADDDFYAPVSRARGGAEYCPANVPASWSRADDDVWTQWLPEHKLGGVEQGWKIHVSCKIGRAPEVLDKAAAVFFAHGIAFKHLACARFFIIAHHKHAARPQSGKFCAAYPPDEKSARQVMTELAAALEDEEGPCILTDRRFGASQVVHYRYGAYVNRSRVLADGSYEMLVRDAYGRDVPDRRGVRFELPEGMTDPFADPRETTPTQDAPSGRSPGCAGYSFGRALAHSNGGGAYQGRELATGRTVFIKESRGHNGLISLDSTSRDRLRHEYQMLRRLHRARPGICPEPLAYFRRREHEYLVTEFVPGTSLQEWCVTNNPIIWTTVSAENARAYYGRCLRILDELSRVLRELHQMGWVFVDLNPGNVLVDENDSARLIDFETSASPGKLTNPIGAPGYFLKPSLAGDDPHRYDEFGLSSLALFMIAPLNNTADHNPAVLAHLRRQLDRQGLIPDSLWQLATRFRAENVPSPRSAPTPEDVDEDLAGQLTALRDRLIAGLLYTGQPDGQVPLGPQSYATNALCVAHGLAGVVHALGKAGVPAPGMLERLRQKSMRDASTLPPGMDVGLAGIAWVLADHGLLEEARTLLTAADAHPVLGDCATLGQGKAGVGLTHLALFGHTGDGFHLDRAAALADAIPRGTDLAGKLGPNNAIGLTAGRAGIALLDFYLAGLTGQHERLASGLRLLTADLCRAVESTGGLLFPVSDADRRIMPYLFAGTAGVGMVTSRFLDATGDERLARVMPGLLAGVACPFTLYGGLYAGMAGIGLFLHDHARRHADETAARRAQRAAKRMFLYAVPHGEGSWVMGELGLRMSGDLWYGSAGVLVFLTQLLNDQTDPLFTLDRLCPDLTRAGLRHREHARG
jgi:hypothetical protein